MKRLLLNNVQVKAYKIRKCHLLTDAMRKVRLEKVKALLQRQNRGEIPNIVFSDEKLFVIEQNFNRQNDRVWLSKELAHSSEVIRATKTQKPASVMVWAGVCSHGRTPLVFIPSETKINKHIYIEQI